MSEEVKTDNSFTGSWVMNAKLSKQYTKSQKPFMEAIQRSRFECRAADKALEFCDLVVRRKEKCAVRFEKRAKHLLKNGIFRFFQEQFEKISKKKEYIEELTANAQVVEHEDDSKGFGKSTSQTFWHPDTKTVQVMWKFKKNKRKIMIDVQHFVRDGHLHIVLTTQSSDGPVINHKVFDRAQPSEYIQSIKRKHLI